MTTSTTFWKKIDRASNKKNFIDAWLDWVKAQVNYEKTSFYNKQG
jgi:hypothetical protein